jgi:hypothetical protein
MRSTKTSSKLVGFCLTVLGLAACQAVAGIEDRKLDPNAGKVVYSQQCHDYCDLVMDACTGKNTVYTTKDICLGVCSHLDPGDDEDTTVNTVACRQFYADEATREPIDNCRFAGPGGGGKCGTDCQAYCQLFPDVCPDDYKYKSTADCLKFCGALPDQKDFDVARDHGLTAEHGGDTIECRLVHTSSATLKPAEHCPHANIFPEEPWCIGLLDQAPSCEDYCAIEMVACTGALAQYQTNDECLAVCEALPPGTNVDEVGNTVGCRRYHAFNSTLGPDNHCAHSGPTGDGHCGHDDADNGYLGNCDSYCTLLAKACPTEFDNELGSAEKCMEACSELEEAPADSKYSVKNAEKSTGLHCRVLYTVRAFADDAACASAMGGDQCEP